MGWALYVDNNLHLFYIGLLNVTYRPFKLLKCVMSTRWIGSC